MAKKSDCEHKCNELAVLENELKHLQKHSEACDGKHKITAKELEEIRICQAKSKSILTPKLVLYILIGVFALGMVAASFTRLPEFLLANPSTALMTAKRLNGLVSQGQ